MDSVNQWDHWVNPTVVPPPRRLVVVGTAPPTAGSTAGVVQGLVQHMVVAAENRTSASAAAERNRAPGAGGSMRMFKLLRGTIDQAGWTGEIFPNASTNWIGGDAVELCSFPANNTFPGKLGCLFDVEHDPGEHVDLAAAYPDVVNQMVRTMEEMEKTVYLPDRGSDTGQACAKSKEYGGYFGPFLSDADFDIGAEDIMVFNSE